MSFKRNLLIVGFAASAVLLTGCNTTRGVVYGAGEDVRAVTTTVAPAHRVRHTTVRRYHRTGTGAVHHHRSTTTTTTNDGSNDGNTNNTSNTNTTTKSTTTNSTSY